MGQSISSLVEDLQQNAEKEKLANDAMNSLIELAKMQVEAFELAIRNTSDTVMIPIDKILEKDHLIQCNISNDPSKVGDMIGDIFSSFISGDILGGVSKLVNNGLKILLGSYSGNSSTRDTYAITCGDLGGISRIDMHFYSYRYTSSQLTDIAKQVLCVSIVRSSVDPTKLSDATLRNIVQNTYSSSTLEEQTKMYNQLYAARDADLQSRSMSAGPTPSIKAFIAMANNYTHPTMKLAVKAANGTNGTNGTASPAPAYFRCTTAFSVTLQMNTAEKNVEPLKHWIEGNLYAGLGQYIANNGMTVVAQRDVRSNSNSVIVGSVTLLHTESSADLDQKIRKQLNAALKGAVSDKCPIPASSYTIEAALPLDGDGVNGTSDQDHQIKPEDEEDLPDEDFSDVEEIVKDLKSAPSTTSKKISVHGVSKFVQSGPVGWQRLQTGREYAWSPAIDCRCERNTEWTQFYLYPLFTNRHVPQLVHDLFQQFGSHMHLSMTQNTGSPALYELDSIVLTIRAPADHNTVADRPGSPYGFYWHYKPEVQIPGTMDATKLSWAASFWINEGINNHNISDTFQRLRADPVAWQAYLDEWVLLENNLVKVLDRMFGQGGWHL